MWAASDLRGDAAALSGRPPRKGPRGGHHEPGRTASTSPATGRGPRQHTRGDLEPGTPATGDALARAADAASALGPRLRASARPATAPDGSVLDAAGQARRRRPWVES